jgi:hypothetical protein
MLTKTKAVLAAVLVLGSTSFALAQSYDPNLSNRYPEMADPGVYGYMPNGNAPTWMHGAPGTQASPQATLQSAPVRLQHGRDAALTNGQQKQLHRHDVGVQRRPQ